MGWRFVGVNEESVGIIIIGYKSTTPTEIKYCVENEGRYWYWLFLNQNVDIQI